MLTNCHLKIILLAFASIFFCTQPRTVAFAQEANIQSTGDAATPPAPLAAKVTDFYVVEKVAAEKKKINTEIEQLTAKVSRLDQEKKTAEKTRDALDRQAYDFDNSAASQSLKSDISNYKATCEGRMNYGADIGRCDNAKASIDQRLGPHNRTFGDLQNKFNSESRKASEKKREIVLADTRLQKLKNYVSWLESTDSKLTEKFRQDCNDLPADASMEDIKHRCGNIKFDGASIDLPVCETKECRTWDAYFKPSRTAEQAIKDYKNSGKANPTKNPLLDKPDSVPAPTTK